MQAEGDFPLCFTALDRELCSGAERALVAIKQHPTRRGAQPQHSWCTPRACVSPQHTVTHCSLVLEIAAQTLCFCIHEAASHSWLPLSVMVCFWTSELWRDMFKVLINDHRLLYIKVLHKTSMKSSVLPPSVFEVAEHVLSPLIVFVFELNLRVLFSQDTVHWRVISCWIKSTMTCIKHKIRIY